MGTEVPERERSMISERTQKFLYAKKYDHQNIFSIHTQNVAPHLNFNSDSLTFVTFSMGRMIIIMLTSFNYFCIGIVSHIIIIIIGV